ncbi:helix-turn-helix transcriptional regulator [Streptomyces profundus]|uniref:helix-turn-helix transcriptional regulator n=1 Tax=Streptomyces profundus TaxID=2867410 RepID=UPI001D164865|nr:LuxR family transcriptional regulator [Streptomyces sp. MA3_2.13]UED87407.1 AAA family ATPase [Streptomyces sp. MA3_2.13]
MSDGTASEYRDLIERQGQSRVLSDALTACRTRRSGGLVLVEGGFGTGKSTLLRRVRSQAQYQGFTVLRARGNVEESAFSYGVARQLVEPLLDQAVSRDDDTALSGAMTAAVHLLGWEKYGRGTEEETLLPLGLRGLLAELARRRPLLLLVDDLHWADAASLRLIRALATDPGTRSVLCCATAARPGRADLTQLTVAFEQASRLSRLSLPALSEEGVGKFLDGVVGPVDAETAHACFEATGGNPFLLHELVEELRGAGHVEAFSAPGRIARTGTGNVARSTLTWIEHAAPGQARNASAVARALAVLRTASDTAQLAAVADLGPAETADAVRALRALGVLAPGTPLRFVSPMVRNALYQQLPQALRYRLHYAAAEALEAAEAEPRQVAEHLRYGPPRQSGRSAILLVAAGGAALGEGDYASAMEFYRAALREPVPERALPTLLAGLGEAELRSGDTAGLDRLRRAAELTREPDRRAAIALRLSSALSVAVRYGEALDVLRAAHEVIGGGHGELTRRVAEEQARITELLPAMRALVTPTAPRGQDQSADSQGERVQRAYEALIVGRSADQVTRLCQEVLTDRVTVHAGDGGARAPWLIAFCLVHCCRYAEARTVLDGAIQQVEALGDHRALSDLRALRAYANAKGGTLAEAEGDARAALRGSAAGQPLGLGRPYAVLALVSVSLERHQIALAERALDRYGAVPEPPYQAAFIPLLTARARVRLVGGDVAVGVDDLLRAIRLLDEWGATSPSFSPAPQAVHGLLQLGRPDEARRLATGYLAEARAFGAPELTATALCAHARTVAGTRSIDSLEEAVALLDDAATPKVRCSVLLRLGTALRESGLTTSARQRLRTADDIAEAAGLTALGRSARQELAAMGVRIGASPRTNASGLTPRERRVAELATEGKRNQEIANILFVTVKTVEWHLSQAYRKLGITSRADLPKLTSTAEGVKRVQAGVSPGGGPGGREGRAGRDSRLPAHLGEPAERTRRGPRTRTVFLTRR